MNPVESPHLHARFTTTKGDLVVVNAWRGVQAVGRISGNPLDDTAFGRVVLTVRGGDGMTELIFENADDADGLIKILGRGVKVAETRNLADDKPHPGFD